MSCNECDRLRRENRELREELEEWRTADGAVADSSVHDLSRKLKVRPRSAKMLVALMKNPGETLTHYTLVRAMGYEGKSERRSVSVCAHHLRKAGIPVKNVWGIGERIDLADAERVRAMM